MDLLYDMPATFIENSLFSYRPFSLFYNSRSFWKISTYNYTNSLCCLSFLWNHQRLKSMVFTSTISSSCVFIKHLTASPPARSAEWRKKNLSWNFLDLSESNSILNGNSLQMEMYNTSGKVSRVKESERRAATRWKMNGEELEKIGSAKPCANCNRGAHCIWQIVWHQLAHKIAQKTEDET